MWLVELMTEIDGDKVQRTFSKDHILIGRAESNDFVLHDPRVSSLHGQIVLREDVFFYQDLQSTNGSMVESGGERFVVDGVKFKEHRLKAGDLLMLGDIQQPVLIRVEIFEGEAEGEETHKEGKTILASRAISDFSLLSRQILDDKSLVRSLFRLQKEIHEQETSQEIYQHSMLFLLNHVPNAEYVALHREETVMEAKWRQIAFSSKTKDISQELKGAEKLFDEVWEQRRALLLDADQLIGIRSAMDAARPLRTMILSPLIQQERVIGFIEIGNTGASSSPLDESDLDLVSVVSYILSARVVNLRLMEVVREAEEKLKNENIYLKSMIQHSEDEHQLIGESTAMKAVQRQIETVAPSDLTVMILGETGTGKELVARAIHRCSRRRHRIFAAVNCGTFSDTLLESELFGHVKGAYTGAINACEGRFERAQGGTLFLDEVGNLPLPVQAKLLRVLQERRVERVGGHETILLDVRVISATNVDLKQQIRTGSFRQDLYYRLNEMAVSLPPLREREGDIRRLARRFVEQYAACYRRPVRDVSEEALQILEGYTWPGNVRELESAMKFAVVLADDVVLPEHLPPDIGGLGWPTVTATTATAGEGDEERLRVDIEVGLRASEIDLKALGTKAAEQAERSVLTTLVRRGRPSGARMARMLNVDPKTLRMKLRKYGLETD